MSIHINENGTIKNTAVDGSRVAIRVWPDYSSPYSASKNSDYQFSSWVDEVDRPYLTITNPSVDYIWPFVPNYIVYIPTNQSTAYNMASACIIRQGADITRTVGDHGGGGWFASYSPEGAAVSSFWVYGKSRISLSGNAMTITYFDIDLTRDKHSPDDHRPICGIFIAIAE